MSVNKTVENVYIRQDAVQLTRKHFWPLVGMGIVVNIISNVVNNALTEIGDLLMIPEVNQLTSQLEYLSSSGKLTSTEPLIKSTIALFTSPKFIVFNLIFMFLTGLVGAGLALGRTREMIDGVRGGIIQVKGVFGLMRYCLKGLALNIWRDVKTVLWMLPGIAVLFLGGMLANLDLPEIGNFVMIVGFTLTFGLFIPALLRYSLATPLLADEPNLGVRECVMRSTALMKDRKWQYFKLGVPAWLKIIGVTFAATLAGTLLETLLALDYATSTVVTDLLITAATIYFSLQLDMVYTVFYEKARWSNPEEKPVKPVSYWLREHTETDIEEASADAAEDALETPAESIEDSPADMPSEANEETKENEQ